MPLIAWSQDMPLLGGLVQGVMQVRGGARRRWHCYPPAVACRTLLATASAGRPLPPLFAGALTLPAAPSSPRSPQEAAVPFSSLLFGRAGEQFFLADCDGGRPPLLTRLAADHPEEGLYHRSALCAFRTRTLYANSSGDHLVGWANSSLRRLEELPCKGGKGAGVVREDPLEAAWWPEEAARVHAAPAAAGLQLAAAHTVMQEEIMVAESPEELAQHRTGSSGGGAMATKAVGSAGRQRIEVPVAAGAAASVASQGSDASVVVAKAVSAVVPTAQPAIAFAGSGSGITALPDWMRLQDPEQAAQRQQRVDGMLASLQAMPWRRIDVCFGDTLLPLLSHQHIQASNSRRVRKQSGPTFEARRAVVFCCRSSDHGSTGLERQ